MAITNVDVNRLNEPKYAQYCIVNGCDAQTRCKIASIHGADKVKVWESVDSTKYEIADEDYSKAYDAGKQNVKDSVGYDGHKSYRAVGDAVLDTGAQVAARTVVKKAAIKAATAAVAKEAATKQAAAAAAKAAAETAAKKATEAATKKAAAAAAGNVSKEVAENATKSAMEATSAKVTEQVANEAAEKATQKASEKSASVSKKAGFIIGCTLALAEGIKYTASKPNKDQVEAARKLQAEELPTSQGNLESAQADMLAASEEVMDLTEEANDANEEANEQIEEDKTLLDFYRKQYEALKAKAEAAKNGGTPLTADEKALMQKLAPMMEDMAEGINTTNEETSDTVNELYDQIEGYQASYDDGAETIAQVEAVTDYAEGFDSNTKTMCYVEGGVQTLNAGMAAKDTFKAGQFAMSGGWTTAWAWAFAAMGAAGGALSTKGATEQFSWSSEVSNEIDTREATQDLGNVTNEVYETELDSFAGNMEVVEDLEIEIPEDLEVPDTSDLGSLTADTRSGEDVNDPLAAAAAGVKDKDDEADNNTRSANDNSNQSGLPKEKDPDYVNKMGKGSDWHEVANGNIKRDNDDEIVKDSSGKVVLIGSYANAIKSATGAEEGEHFSKDDIPKVLETLLGSPFDEKMIKRIRNGHKLNSEYTALILGTKDQDTKGTTTVDNSDKATAIAKRVIDFYYPIFSQASTKGWVKG